MGKFEVMALSYAPEGLEPVISRETIAFHHGKHLAAYVNNLNGLLEGNPMADLALEEIAYSGDTRSPILVISVHSVSNLQYRRQS